MDLEDLLKAELYREIGEFELAIQFLKSLEVTEETKELYRKILQQTKQHNRKVFVLYGKIPRSALTLDDYQEEPYTPSQDDDEPFTSELQ